MRAFIVSFFILFCVIQAMAMNVPSDSTALPKVFILGQYESGYENLFEKHSTVLLEVCNDDMDVAYDKWLGMLEEMEDYANSIEYDIKGIRVWLNIFWDKSGAIKHIAFHLKVNSRNVNQEELAAFFSSFMNHYTFPVVSDNNFSHYGSASFPTFARRVKKNEEKSAISKKKPKNTKDGVGKY